MKKIVFSTITITIASTFLYSQDIWSNVENTFFNPVPNVSETDNDRDIPHYRQKQLIKLEMRKKYDLFGATVMYGYVIINNIAHEAGFNQKRGNISPILYIPALGHLFSADFVPDDLENAYAFAGLIETLFLIDYGITSYRISRINKKYSYQFNINPIVPSASLSFYF